MKFKSSYVKICLRSFYITSYRRGRLGFDPRSRQTQVVKTGSDNSHCSMAMSTEHRSFAALHRHWWHLHMSEQFSNGTIIVLYIKSFLKFLESIRVVFIYRKRVIFLKSCKIYLSEFEELLVLYDHFLTNLFWVCSTCGVHLSSSEP